VLLKSDENDEEDDSEGMTALDDGVEHLADSTVQEIL